MVAERRESRINTPELTIVAPDVITDVDPMPYQSGGHGVLVAEAQFAGSIRLTDADLVTRSEVIHPLFRGILHNQDIEITSYGLSKSIDRETGEGKIIEIFRGE